MKIDPYAPCPCGSGKKIKFCCGDLANDIERVVRMVEGDQRLAALQLLNQLLKKHPSRVALLDLKAGIAQSMGQHDEARVAIDRILDAQPDNVNALARRAIALAMDGQAREAAATLQEATSIDEEEIPPSVHEAFLHVGRALLDTGHILAAMAHFDVHFRAQPDDIEDVRGAKMLLQLNHSGGLPLLVRDDLDLLPCPRGAAWATAFEKASVAASHAAWRHAAEQFERLLETSDRAPAVVYNLALVRGWLGETRAMVAGLRQFARLDVPEDEAVESLALANLLDHGHEDDMVARVEQTFEVPDQDHLLEVLASDGRLRSVPGPDAVDDGDGPPPLARYSLLDRPMPAPGEDLAYEDVPVVLGLITVFGRETDRPPRFVLMTVKNANFEVTQRQFDTVTESVRGALVGEEVLGSIDRVYDAMVPRWSLPDGVPGDRQMELAAEQRRRAIADIWPTIPQHALGGLSPDAAARDPQRRIQLLAAVLVLATTSLAGNETAAIAALRERLGVGEPAPIDPTSCRARRLGAFHCACPAAGPRKAGRRRHRASLAAGKVPRGGSDSGPHRPRGRSATAPPRKIDPFEAYRAARASRRGWGSCAGDPGRGTPAQPRAKRMRTSRGICSNSGSISRWLTQTV